jgi:N utilization substance protein B
VLPGTRREARERALELLYEAEAKEVAPKDVLVDLVISPDPFAVEIVEGVGERLGEIDAAIEGLARDWTVARMPWVDRNILRIGAYELIANPDVPMAVVINEAVDLAKRFSTEEAGRFVNGVLSALAKERRPEG